MPITMYAKPSPEKSLPGWRTTRFWLSVWALGIATGTALWGALAGLPEAAGAGALSGAIVAGAYVWALSREA